MTEHIPKAQWLRKVDLRERHGRNASKNDASEIRGDSIISDCWSILTLNPNFHKPIHDDPPRKRATAKAHKRHIEVAPVASSPTNPLSMESKPSSSSSSAAKVETTQAADEEAEMQINSRKSRRARRREKFLAFKVSRRNRKWKRCPNAPHNTTSFLMEYHKDEQPFRSDEDAEMDFDFFGNRTYDYYDDSSESGMCDEEKNDDSDGSNNLSTRSGRTSRSWQDYLDNDEVVSLVQR
mmetsp:Transcript_18901/g.25849  ORF Transcript_18901/g.25849 Transcript_18901/m.25849 type:complete len:237 (-) Transcript_18901:1158-1868(-)